MNDTFDIIIIGAGIFGCALYHELSKLGSKKILLIEKNSIASGITGQSGGLIRKFYLSSLMKELTNISYDYYLNFNSIVGMNCGFRKTGCRYFLPELGEYLLQDINNLNSSGYTIEYFDHNRSNVLSDLKSYSQNIIVFEPNAGCVDTQITTHSWLNSPYNMNCTIKEHTDVKKLIAPNNVIRGIETTQGIFYANHIILAAGAHNKLLLSQLSIQISLAVKSFQYCIYEYDTKNIPAILDLKNDIYIVPLLKNELIVGFLSKDKVIYGNELTDSIDNNQTNLLHEFLTTYYPSITQKHRLSTHIAIDCFNSDATPFTGSISQIQGLFIAGIGNGGGIKIAPAIAQQLTTLLMERS